MSSFVPIDPNGLQGICAGCRFWEQEEEEDVEGFCEVDGVLKFIDHSCDVGEVLCQNHVGAVKISA